MSYGTALTWVTGTACTAAARLSSGQLDLYSRTAVPCQRTVLSAVGGKGEDMASLVYPVLAGLAQRVHSHAALRRVDHRRVSLTVVEGLEDVCSGVAVSSHPVESGGPRTPDRQVHPSSFRL